MDTGDVDLDAVRSRLDDRAAAHTFSGLAVVWRDGAPVFEHAAGLAHRGHGVPVSTRTRFNVASVTKLITAATALRLVDDGVLDVLRPLVDVLPPEHRPEALTDAHTLHHLLSHTSGLANYHVGEDQTWASFLAAWDRVPTYRVRDLADMLPLFADRPAVRPPGEEWEYADANFVLAGLVIEAATGRPFRDVAAELVLTPAGMADSTFHEDLDTEPARLATGYFSDDDAPYERWKSNVYGIPAAGMPDGGVITTPYDLARLLDALPALLSEPSFRAMTTPSFPKTPIYGYGCELAVRDGRVIAYGHEGCDPGITAAVFSYPDDATTIAVTCNVDRGAWPAAKILAEAFGVHEPRD